MGEFSPPPPPFSEPPSSFSFLSLNIEIIFDSSDIITKFTPHFKILDPPLLQGLYNNDLHPIYHLAHNSFKLNVQDL